jgi:CheY-like chemotaxis protein
LNSFFVSSSFSFAHVTEHFARFQPQLVLMDITLPFYNGYHWCSEIRKLSSVPIVFLSSASDNMNIVMAMNMGGDDFIAKPFDADVVCAKIGAMLRRTYSFGTQSTLLEHHGTILNVNEASLTCGEEKLEKEAARDRYLPIWIGPWEASAIAMKLQGLTPERPLTHDLFATTLEVDVNWTDDRRRLWFFPLRHSRKGSWPTASLAQDFFGGWALTDRDTAEDVHEIAETLRKIEGHEKGQKQALDKGVGALVRAIDGMAYRVDGPEPEAAPIPIRSADGRTRMARLRNGMRQLIADVLAD